MKVFGLLLLFCTFAFVSALVDDPTKQALLDLYSSTEGANWKSAKNWGMDDPCENEWIGVYCNEGNTKVITLILNYNNLVGPLPDSLGDISGLLGIYFMGNSLKGPIPSTIENLTELQVLDLKANQLSGEIPSKIVNLKNLSDLDLSSNNLSGTLPSIGQMSALSLLEIQRNSFSGPIPDLSGTVLTSISLRYNQFTGSIPESLNDIPTLDALLLNNNLLSGKLPDFLQSKPWQYNVINLANNQFECPLPDWCGEKGDGSCTPCVLPSPSPSPNVIPSSSPAPTKNGTNDDNNDNDNDKGDGDNDGSSAWVIILIVILSVCVVGVLVAAIAGTLIVMKKKKLGFFGRFQLINEDENGEQIEQGNDLFTLGDSNVIDSNDGEEDEDNTQENNALVDPNAI